MCYSTKIAKHAHTNVQIEGKQEVIAPQAHIHNVASLTKFIKNMLPWQHFRLVGSKFGCLNYVSTFSWYENAQGCHRNGGQLCPNNNIKNSESPGNAAQIEVCWR